MLHRPRVERFWNASAEALCRYFRVDVRGLERIPRHGPVIVVANHSGCIGADAVVLAHLIHSRARREAHVLAHPFYFESSGALRSLSVGFGMTDARFRCGVRALRLGQVLLVFPEGASGNFKSSLKRYRLQRFHTGFVRMALTTGATIVPCVVTGAEESNWNLGSVNLDFLFQGLRLPIPLNVVPLPAKWRIRFLPPISAAKLRAKAGLPRHSPRIERVAETMRSSLQGRLLAELRKREYLFVPPLKGTGRFRGVPWL